MGRLVSTAGRPSANEAGPRGDDDHEAASNTRTRRLLRGRSGRPAGSVCTTPRVRSVLAGFELPTFADERVARADHDNRGGNPQHPVLPEKRRRGIGKCHAGPNAAES